MPDLFDNIADYSKVASGFTPVVAAGLTSYALFGRNLPSSLLNWANPAAPIVDASAVTVGPVSGVTTTSSNSLVLPDAPTVASETIFLVMSVNPTSWSSFIASPFGSNPVNSNTGTAINCQNGIAGLQASIGLIIGGAAGSRVCSVTAGGLAILSGDAATQEVIVLPQLYMLKIDVANLLITMQNMSQVAASWKNTIVMAAGTTRAPQAVSLNYGLQSSGAGSGSAVNSSNTYHAYAHYNRATVASEDALVSSQLRKIMATRGITV